MKIARNIPEQLILDYTPWLMSLGMLVFTMVFVFIGMGVVLSGDMFGLIFVLGGGGVGFAVFAVFAQRVQIILDRASNVLTLRRRSLFGYHQEEHSLSDVSHAILETTRSSKGSTLYRPSLVLTGMSAGTHPIVKAYGNGRSPSRTVQIINEWLETEE